MDFGAPKGSAGAAGKVVHSSGGDDGVTGEARVGARLDTTSTTMMCGQVKRR
jgi:hypothetical protein